MQTFKFEELTDPAKEKVRQWYAQNTDNYWAEHIIEHAKEEGLKRGFNIEDILWAGFYSQGDGASWHGRVDVKKFLEHHLTPDNTHFGRYTVLAELVDNGCVDEKFTVYIRSFMYKHSGMMRAEGPASYSGPERMLDRGILAGANYEDLYESIGIDDMLERLTAWALDEAKSYADDIYKRLEKEHDYEISDEHIQETADINGWRFDADGTFQ